MVSFGLALGPLLVANDQPFINQRVIIKQNSYFEDTEVDFETLKIFSTRLFTFSSVLNDSVSLKDKERLFRKVLDTESWSFIQEFLSKWTDTDYRFDKFKG